MDDQKEDAPPPKKQLKLFSYATFPQTSSSTSLNKTKKAESTAKRKLFIDYEKRINTMTQIPADVKEKHMRDDYLIEYDRFVKMAESN